MKRYTFVLLFLMALQGVFGQKVYFIYLQTEQGEPFFVRMNDKIFSSEASGYLILSKMYDSTYNFSVGFPQNKWPEQKFAVKMNTKDHGYLVKNFGDKGWGLFDLQTLGIQMAAMNESRNDNAANAKVSSFTEMLAKATDDSTLKQKPIEPKTEEKKVDVSIQPVEKKEEVKTKLPVQVDNSATDKKNEIVQQEVKNDKIKSAPSISYKRSTVIRKSESSTTKGFSLIYIDDYGNGTKDTIRITIPNPVVMQVIKQEPKQDIKFLDIGDDSVKTNKAASSEITNQKPKQEEINRTTGELRQEKVAVKTNCQAVASHSDFYILRKNMAAETSDDDMIDDAKKYFKTKCFTTSQIKNLSALFLNSDGKYKFFDAAYLYVSDAENFGSLQSELKDEYYINRFKAMLRN
ncbi:MAG TPA: DUF4476 domain-containing protein [Chitinophagaceae bacterium]|nr:DUF4476 domain-containing protein [Chitinophagaceae bacterium]